MNIIRATILFVVTISCFMIAFTVLSDPVTDVIDKIGGSSDEEEVGAMASNAITAFFIVFILSMGGAIIWYVAKGHQTENESQYYRRYR